MKKYIKILYIIVVVLLCNKGSILAQPKEKQEYVSFESVVKDTQGAPVSGANILGKEGITLVKTDSEGRFTIDVPKGTLLLVESDGYESAVLTQDEAKAGVVLKATPYRFGEKDNVKIAFGETKTGDLIGNISVIEPDNLIKYDNSQNVSDALNCRIPGMIGSNQIHYLGDALVVLDGLPRYSNINAVDILAEEVDQITVIKDINAVALYGSQARNGVIIITTKRGKPYKRNINVSFYQGIAKPKATPKYLNSADYMELYNEARVNDGLTELYDDATIANYRNGNPLRYPSVDYYSPDYIKPFYSNTKLLSEFSGGNENASFYANFGWSKDGNLMDFGPNKNIGNNRFNARVNVDFKITNFIKSRLDVGTIFSFNKSNKGNYWSSASTLRPNLFTPLLPLSLISTNSNPTLVNLIEGRKNDVDGIYLLGGTAQDQSTPFADIYSGGYNQSVSRTLQFNNALDVDLGMITKGLSLKTNVSFDFYNSYVQSISNTYAIYEPTWSATSDSIVGLTKYGNDVRANVQGVGGPDFLRRMGFSAQFDYIRTFASAHNVNATVLGFYNTVKDNGTFQPFKHAHVGLRLGYNYNHIFYADFSGAYVNSAKLAEGNRGAFSPTLSFACELKNVLFAGVKSVNYLKVKASAGIINTDISMPNYFLYDDKYAASSNFNWSDNSYSNASMVSQYGPNSSLTFEKRKEINFGFEGQFLNRSLIVEANYFTTRLSDKTSFRNDAFPSYFSTFVPYENYEEDALNGLDFGITGSKKMGDFGIDLGVKGMYWSSKAVTRDEVWAYDYLYRTGKSTDASFGLVAEGLFKDQADIDAHAVQTFGGVKPGDIKYVDQNNDGFVDANDQVKIGRGSYPLSLGVELKLTYKRFTFFTFGRALIGADAYKNNNYYWVDGTDKYSDQVLNRWTPATAETATFPRLTSLAASNNYRQSTYWMYKNNAFQILRMQLTYDLPESICKKVAMKNLSVSISGANFLTFSKVNEIRDLNVGSAPQNSYFTLGIRSTF